MSVVGNSDVFSLLGSSKHIKSTGIAVGMSTVVRYTGDVRCWESINWRIHCTQIRNFKTENHNTNFNIANIVRVLVASHCDSIRH